MADKILIKFELDRAELDHAIDGLVLLGKVDKATADQFKAANAEFATRKQALTDNAAATDKAAKSIDTMSKNLAEAAAQSKKTNDAIISNNKAIDDQAQKTDDASGKTVSLRTEIRQLTEEIARAKAGGGPVSQDSLDRVGKLKKAMTEAKEEIKNVGSVTPVFNTALGAVKGLAAGFEVAAGASALFGAKDEDLDKTLKKVTGSIALVNGLTEIQNTLRADSAVVTGFAAAKQALLAGVTAEMGAAEIFATVTTTALTIAIDTLAAPIGVILVALGGLVAAYESFTESSRNAELAQKRLEEQEKANLKLDKIFIETLNEKAKATEEGLKFSADLLKAEGKSKEEIFAKEKIALQFEIDKNAAAVGFATSEKERFKAQEALSNSKNKLAVTEAQFVTDSEKEKATAQKKANDEAFKAAINAEKQKLIGLKEALIKQLEDERITKAIFDSEFEKDTEASLRNQLDIEKRFGKDTIATQEAIDNDHLGAIVKGQEERRKQAEKEKAQNAKNATEDLAATLKNIDLSVNNQLSSAKLTAKQKLDIQLQGLITERKEIEKADITADERDKQLLAKEDEIEKKKTEILVNAQKVRDDILKKAGQGAITLEQEGFKIFSELNKRQAEEAINASQSKANNEIASLDRQLAHKTISQATYDKRRKDIETKAAQEQAKIKREEFEKQKQADIIQAIIKGALAVVTAYDVDPTGILATVNAVVAASQVALIASQPTPKFAKGVERLSGKGSGTSDSIHAMLSAGERIVPADINDQYFPALSAIHNKRIDSKLLNGFALGEFSLADIHAAKALRDKNMGIDEYGMRRAVNGAKIHIANADEVGVAMAGSLNDLSYYKDRYSA